MTGNAFTYDIKRQQNIYTFLRYIQDILISSNIDLEDTQPHKLRIVPNDFLSIGIDSLEFNSIKHLLIKARLISGENTLLKDHVPELFLGIKFNIADYIDQGREIVYREPQKWLPYYLVNIVPNEISDIINNFSTTGYARLTNTHFERPIYSCAALKKTLTLNETGLCTLDKKQAKLSTAKMDYKYLKLLIQAQNSTVPYPEFGTSTPPAKYQKNNISKVISRLNKLFGVKIIELNESVGYHIMES